METISVAEFYEGLVNFRKNVTFNPDVTIEERKDAFQEMKRSHLNINQTDPNFSDLVTTMFDITVIEFEMWTLCKLISLDKVS